MAWGLIIIGIGLMMHTFLKSANASDDLWKITDDFIGENCLNDDEQKLTDKQCEEIRGKLNAILEPTKIKLKKSRKRAVNSFLFGIFMFALFVCINLIRENNRSSSKNNSYTIKKLYLNDTIILQNQKQ